MTLPNKLLTMKPQDAEELIYFTIKEVAILADTCERTIKRHVAQGKLEETKRSRRCNRYSLRTVKAYLAGKYPSTAVEGSPGGLSGNDAHDSSPVASDEALQKRLLAAKTSAFARKSAEKGKKGGKKAIINSLSHPFKVVVLWPDLDGAARN